MTGSLNAYAKHRKAAGLLGGSLQAVQNAMNAGRITVGQDTSGYVIDFAVADAQWAANTHPTQGRERKPKPKPAQTQARQTQASVPPPKPTGPVLVEANSTAVKFNQGRALKMGYEAGLAELSYKERTGQLVDRAEEESKARALATEVRVALLAIPARLAASLASEPDPMKVRTILDAELNAALERLSSAS